MPFVSEKISLRKLSGSKRKRVSDAAESVNTLTPTKRVCLINKVVSSFSPLSRRQVVDHLSLGDADEAKENLKH